MIVGEENAPLAVPSADPSGVDAAVLLHVAFAVFVNEDGEGAEEYVHAYSSSTEPFAGTEPVGLPWVIEQVPPSSMVSVTPVRATASQSFGLATVIVPVT